jgi:hypothetical protein
MLCSNVTQLFLIEDNTLFPPLLFLFFNFFVFFILLKHEKEVKKCHCKREETSVSNNKNSSMRWNIPMLNAKELMQDMDTQVDVSSRCKGCQDAKDILKAFLGEH